VVLDVVVELLVVVVDVEVVVVLAPKSGNVVGGTAILLGQ
jgi:hypothetical protein